MSDLDVIEAIIAAAPAAARARETAIWLELRAMFARQEARLAAENELRAAEGARERELRDELETLHGHEQVDLLSHES